MTLRLLDFRRISPRLLPFADVATADLPLGRLLRLSLFQVSVGMAVVLLTGTLNRVMIVEMSVPTALVAAMISLPLLFAPARALIGFRSDEHRSLLGWRRVPYIWFGTLLQFGGLAIMPFALLLLSEGGNGPSWAGEAGAALAFLMVGAGLHTTQTAGLALACDLAPREARPRVVALLYVMLLIGMVASALLFGRLLMDFTNVKLIQVIQGAALATMALNLLALWKQEARRPDLTAPTRPRRSFADAWAALTADRAATRLLVATALGTAGFSMQDVLLEPYGGEILGLSVGRTTELTALLAGGTLAGFAIAARQMGRAADPHRLAAWGVLVGIGAFALITFAAPLSVPALFQVGVALIGLGGGLFVVSTLTAAMALGDGAHSGLALGAWGAVHASAAGLAIAVGGAVRDVVGTLSASGRLGQALADPSVAYSVVYHIEIALLFVTLVAIGPLVRYRIEPAAPPRTPFGLAELPS
ncbi:BCD family MFS transporter [Acuticoccus sp.]|uniref:BCD family MFS transporter n=1 Tax=Acuticoccus sp. TaxID=1904378 RepID=UPI003B51DD9E